MYKPEVSMIFYKAGTRLNSGSDVKLGDKLTMIMNVTNNANGNNKLTNMKSFTLDV